MPDNRTIVSLEKMYETAEGKVVSLSSLTGEGDYPVVGQRKQLTRDKWIPCSWDLFGKSSRTPSEDLREIDPYKHWKEGDIIEISMNTGRKYYKAYALNGETYVAGVGTEKRSLKSFIGLNSLLNLDL